MGTNISCLILFHLPIHMCYDIIFNYTITHSFSPMKPLAYRVHNSYPTFLFVLFTMWFSLRSYLCYNIQNLNCLQKCSYSFSGKFSGSLITPANFLMDAPKTILIILLKVHFQQPISAAAELECKEVETKCNGSLFECQGWDMRNDFSGVYIYIFCKMFCTQLQCLLTLFALLHAYKFSHWAYYCIKWKCKDKSGISERHSTPSVLFLFLKYFAVWTF